MRKLAFILLIVSVKTLAEEGHGHHEGYNRGYENGYGRERHDDRDGWILPAIVGSAIIGGAVYGYSRPPSPPPPIKLSFWFN